jgi:thymidylate synthase (FAD)
MRIVKPSYEILDRNHQTAVQKIEDFGRLAYKSEDKKTEASSIPFVQKIINSGHFPVLEGANLHIRIEASRFNIERFIIKGINKHKYLQLYYSVAHCHLIISGTIRAFKEAIESKKTLVGARIAEFLYDYDNMLFDDQALEGFFDYSIGITKLTKKDIILLADQYADFSPYDHLMCAVKFIVNRAVTHEMVRHRPSSYIQESQRYCRYDNDKFGNEVTFIDPEPFFSIFSSSPERLMWQKSCEESEKTYLQLLSMHKVTPQAARTVLPNSCKTEIIVYATLTEWRHIFKLRTSPAAEPSMREIMIPLEKEFWNREECFE